MSNRPRFFVAATLATLLLVLPLSARVQGAAASWQGQTGGLTNPNDLNPASSTLPLRSVAPNFSLTTVTGQHYRLSSLRGHSVLLEFIAVWCPHCQRESVVINRIHARYVSGSGRGLAVLSILANPYGREYEATGNRRLADRGDVAWFQRTFHTREPILIDPTFATVNRYGAGSYPTIYILDGKGVVRYASQGEVSYGTLATAVVKASA